MVEFELTHACLHLYQTVYLEQLRNGKTSQECAENAKLAVEAMELQFKDK